MEIYMQILTHFTITEKSIEFYMKISARISIRFRESEIIYEKNFKNCHQKMRD